MASRTYPGCSKVFIVGKVPSRACEAPVGRARVKTLNKGEGKKIQMRL